MHDIKKIRNDPKKFDQQLKKRNVNPHSSSILKIDAKRRKNIESLEILKASVNSLSKDFGRNKSLGKSINEKKFKEEINIIKLGNFEENKSKIIKEQLIRNKIKINYFNSILDFNKSKNPNINFLLLELGFLTFSQVKTLKKYLKLFDINLEGTIIIEKD